jgi:dolichyl-phosphate-mannose-protein mannosyltransferase
VTEAGPDAGPRSSCLSRVAGWVLPLSVTAVAAVIRGWRVGVPNTYLFDEIYYVPDALTYINGGDETSWVHPPLGKWMIASGIRVLGNDPVGWRIASVVFGTIAVLLTYVLALRLLHSRWWATVASALVALDGLQIVQSRVAMLEIFVTTFLLAGALLAHVYTIERGRSGRSERGALLVLSAAGVMFGAALAVKWSALPAIVFTAVALIAASPERRRASLAVGALLCAVPALIYMVSYASFWRRHGVDLDRWLRLQTSMLRFHNGDVPAHPYASFSLGWLLLRRPVAYFYDARGEQVRHIVALGNPLLWWGFVAAIPLLIRAWLRRRERAADVIVLALAGIYLPWLLVRRTSFLYYLTPLVPFMAVGVAWALQRLSTSSLRRPIRVGAVTTYIGAAFVASALLLPVWVGMPIDYDHWRRLMLLRSWI